MLHVALAVAHIAAAVLAGTVLVHLVAQAAVARAMLRRDAACPFEDDDHRPLSPGSRIRLAIAESLRLGAGCLAALRPLPRPGGTGSPVVLLVAPSVPRSMMRGLVRCLDAAGRPAHVLRAPRRRFEERAGGRLASALESARGSAPALDVLAHGGSASFVLHLLASPLGTHLRVRAVVAVGGRLTGVVAPPGVELVSVYSLDDVWLQPPDAGRHPAAFNVALRGEGHFGLLRSARATEIVCENLAGLDAPCARPDAAPATRDAAGPSPAAAGMRR